MQPDNSDVSRLSSSQNKERKEYRFRRRRRRRHHRQQHRFIGSGIQGKVAFTKRFSDKAVDLMSCTLELQ